MKKINLIYVRNYFSLFIISSFIHKNKISNPILIINKCLFKNVNFSIINKFFKKKYYKIIYINWDRTKFIKKRQYSDRNEFIKSLNSSLKNCESIIKRSAKFDFLKKSKVENFFCSGDFFEDCLGKYYSLNCKHHWVEHGIGNLMSFIDHDNDKKILINSIKKIYRYFKSVFYFDHLLRYNHIKYESYIGVCNKSVKNDIVIYGNNVDSIYVECYRIIKEFSKFLSKNFNKQKNKNYVLFIGDKFKISSNDHETIKIANKIKSIINKNEVLLIKPRVTKLSDKSLKENYTSLIKFLNTSKINFQFINKFKKFPAEILIEFYNVKKIISFYNSTSVFSSIIFKNIKHYIFIDYIFKTQSSLEPAFEKKNFAKSKKIFKFKNNLFI